MPAIPHVIRRGAVYYWRRRLPSALAESPRSGTLLFGLRTRDPRRARFLAGQITALADRLFVDVMDQRLDHSQLQTIFRSAFTRHLDKLEAVVARERVAPDFDAEDSRRSDQVMAWVYRLLETRGATAHVDDCARAQMAESGVDDRSIAEVDLMLDAMRKNDMACERPSRLEAAINEVGGASTPMNFALSQQAIFRALSAANFAAARRYDGVRSEDALGIDLILRDRIAEQREIKLAPSSINEHHANLHRQPATRDVQGTIVQPAGSNTSVPKERAGLDVEFPRGASGVRAGDKKPSRKAAEVVRSEEHPVVVLGAKLIAKNAKIWDVKTQRQAGQIYALLAKVLSEQGVFEIGDLRQSHFADLDDLLANVAKSYGKSPQDQFRTTAQLRAVGAAKPPSERGLAPETLNRHLTFLGQLLPFMRSRGLQVDRDIDLTLLRVRTTGRARDKRAIIDDHELAAIFELPCFTGCAGWKGESAFLKGPLVFHRALYFAIILLYYTGARREEVCGLTVDEVGWLDSTPGGKRLPFMQIAANKERRIKNSQSKRFIALHPEIVRLGFFDYVDAIRALGYGLLFPDLKSPTSSSPMGDRLYDEFSRGLAIAIPDASTRKKAIHSLRKTFGNNLKRFGVSAEIRGDMLGHSGATVTEEVYCDPVALKSMMLEIMRVPIVTSHLKAAKIHLLPWVSDRATAPFSRRRTQGRTI
ncbi:DUF6538 domain-containing protein [Beijerinckia sp. L45]|uniref:DUF6538 domain-containing protein n=1 Tax=Beijerinckia sp. L45 TaxID=1641855 RepID=UPI00131EAD48|nr:DUF6538 domain-containing protein [Beijerinckia sp. L45]